MTTSKKRGATREQGREAGVSQVDEETGLRHPQSTPAAAAAAQQQRRQQQLITHGAASAPAVACRLHPSRASSTSRLPFLTLDLVTWKTIPV